MKVLYIDLWKLYVAYVKETKSLLPTYKYVFHPPHIICMIQKHKETFFYVEVAGVHCRNSTCLFGTLFSEF